MLQCIKIEIQTFYETVNFTERNNSCTKYKDPGSNKVLQDFSTIT